MRNLTQIIIWTICLTIQHARTTGYLASFRLERSVSVGRMNLGESSSSSSRVTSFDLEQSSSSSSSSSGSSLPLVLHHTAVKTRNITLAIQFYHLLGFELTMKFRTGPARAAWLEQTGASKNNHISRIELIEVPAYMLNEPEGMKRRALDLFQRQELLGLNHFALDVSDSIREKGVTNLTQWLEYLDKKSIKTFGKTLRVALKPLEQVIGKDVYEIAFLYDADGALVELLHNKRELPESTLASEW